MIIIYVNIHIYIQFKLDTSLIQRLFISKIITFASASRAANNFLASTKLL